jgi:hypothetical protein
MKNLLKIVSIIGLTVITQIAYSAEVTATFTTGDTLTAEKLNNIKSAVNDNDERISNIVLTPGPEGPAGLGAVVFSTAPTVENDMNTYSVGTVWIDTTAATVYILVDNTAGAAVWTIAAAPVTYAIGDTGPAGGFVFSITDGGLHGLEAATEDQTSTAWGCSGDDIAGAIGTAVGTGEQNTAAIIAGCNETTAASVASAYGPGWYLPSKDELNLLYVQKVAGVVGGFASFPYWSSSQTSASLAWLQDFGLGDQDDYGAKYSTNGVRAVRAF